MNGSNSSHAGSRGSAIAEVEISGHETVAPTPDILDAVERDYKLEASIADLVDNSIDAKARKVLIRFVRKGDRLVSLCVADDGRGIRDADATEAMTFAKRRSYGKSDLGMFGLGLKAASLSQADTLIVLSRAAGDKAVGRQWTKSGIKKRAWQLDFLKPESAAKLLELQWGFIGRIRSGTVVRWDQVNDFERLHSGVDAYLEQHKRRIKNHLGLKFYRFLSNKRIRIEIDEQDADSGQVGPPSEVEPMNPFPPSGASGARGYPKEIMVDLPDAGKLTMRLHIWRKKSRDEGYKLGGGRVAEHQGLYFFRHDRLIQDGGWCGLIATNEPHMSLARIEVDIPDGLAGYLKVRSNKVGVDVPASFEAAVRDARARDKSSFDDYPNKAEETYRRRGEQKARPMVGPGSGIPNEVRKALEKRAIRFVRGQKCSIVWERSTGEGFIHVDQNNRRIVLNKRYRSMLLRGAHGGKTDLPLLRTLLYFVFETLIAGDRVGSVERLRLQAIQASMNAALKLEARWAAE
jgi:hypothetical protein